MKILHVITDLHRGGAEIMLQRLLPELAKLGCEQQIVCLSSKGEIGDAISTAGFPVHYLNMKRSRPSLRAFQRLQHIINTFDPNLIQSWLYHADFYVCLAVLFSHRPVVWGLHNSTLGKDATPTTKKIVRVLAFFSRRIPRVIISCSQTAMQVHAKSGYRSDIMTFIPNGFDTQLFQPDPASGKAFRKSIGITDQQILIGSVSRFDQQKNHKGMIEAWRQIALQRDDVRFVLAGKELSDQNSELTQWIQNADLQGKVSLLGIRKDIPALMNGLDLFMLSSNSGEAFPLVIGEAMSCGIPCVGTDVGDTRLMIADCGKCVAANDEDALAQAALNVIDLSDEKKIELKKRCRERIVQEFSLDKMTDAYLAVYHQVLA